MSYHTGAKGVKNHKAKLNPEKIKAIRKSEGKLPAAELAEIYGVDRTHIYKIFRREVWAHVN